MKSIKNYLLVALLLIGGIVALAPGRAAALTDAQKKDCFNTWVGSYYQGTSAGAPAGTFDKVIGKKKADKFTKSDCNKDNGGNCWWGIPTDTKHEVNYGGQQIHCTGADGKDYVDGTYDQGGAVVPSGGSGSTSDLQACDNNSTYQSDPALCGTPCKDKDKCNLITRYVNPIINKFLAPFAIIAVIIGVIWGAILYITSGGDPQKVAQAKDRIQKALIGLLAFIFLYALLNWLIPGGLL